VGGVWRIWEEEIVFECIEKFKAIVGSLIEGKENKKCGVERKSGVAQMSVDAEISINYGFSVRRAHFHSNSLIKFHRCLGFGSSIFKF
jgi:uncharacterized alkaline shock family protein YloU